jgi:hypothetical protein
MRGLGKHDSVAVEKDKAAKKNLYLQSSSLQTFILLIKPSSIALAII